MPWSRGGTLAKHPGRPGLNQFILQFFVKSRSKNFNWRMRSRNGVKRLKRVIAKEGDLTQSRRKPKWKNGKMSVVKMSVGIIMFANK